MTDREQAWVALLRGINVSGQNKIPMAELRSLCAELGCEAVQTYIQSGNVVFVSALPAKELESRLERAIDKKFRLTIPVVVRSAAQWRQYVKSNPFPDEVQDEANWVLLCMSKRPPKAKAAEELGERATKGERVVKKGDAVWIHYASGIGQSKLTPAVLDRYIGSPVTARNWRTVLKLDAMLRESATR